MCFLPREARRRAELEELLAAAVADEGQEVLGWRDVPVEPTQAGATAQLHAPGIRQLFVGARGPLADDQEAFERKLYVIRRTPSARPGPTSSSRAARHGRSSTREC